MQGAPSALCTHLIHPVHRENRLHPATPMTTLITTTTTTTTTTISIIMSRCIYLFNILPSVLPALIMSLYNSCFYTPSRAIIEDILRNIFKDSLFLSPFSYFLPFAYTLSSHYYYY